MVNHFKMKFINKIQDLNIEKALYLQDISTIKKISNKNHFDRIYFGVEFCEKMLPPLDSVKKFSDFSKGKNVPLTFVTPYVSDYGIEKLRPLLELLSKGLKCEVVINDLGVLHMIKNYFPDLRIVLGRILTKQKKDPRISSIKDDKTREYFSRTAIDNIYFRKFLGEFNINRVELDNVLHEINVNKEFDVSLYYPYVYLTTSRNCYINDCNECSKIKFLLRNPLMKRDFILKGKTQFYLNHDLSTLSNITNINRIVLQYQIPY